MDFNASPDSTALRSGIRWWAHDKAHEEYEQPLTESEPSSIHKVVVPLSRFLYERQRLRRQFDLLHARIYGNLRFMGFGLNSYTRVDGVEDDRLTLNIAKNMVGAVVSRITKNRPRVTVLTDGENWGMQRRAKKLEQFLDGVFHGTQFRRKAISAFRNACIYGTGCLKLYAHDMPGVGKDEIRVESVPPWMLIVDDSEAMEGMPRNLYERRYVDRQMLVERFALESDELQEKLSSTRLSPLDEDGYGRDTTADQILVVEGWHLPSGPKAKDGRHVICTENSTLVDESWECERFPYVFLRWSEAPAGFFGQGLVSELIGLSAEINKLLRQIQQAHHLCGWPRVFIPRSARITKNQMNNQIGALIEYDGAQPPTQPNFPVVPSEIYGHLQFLIKSAYEIAGISQLTATSSKPPGVESGIALRTLQDVQSDRFTEIGRAWEQLYADAAEYFVQLARQLGPRFAVKATGREDLAEISFEQAKLDLDTYRLQVFPTSTLPTEPAGKLEWIKDLSELGLFEPLDMLGMLDMPDTSTAVRRLRAGRDAVDRALDFILAETKYISPNPFMDLNYAIRRAQEEMNSTLMKEGAPPKVIDDLERFLLQAQTILNPPPPTPEGGTQLPGLPSPAGPGAPPGPVPPPGMPAGPMPGAPPAPMPGPMPPVGGAPPPLPPTG